MLGALSAFGPLSVDMYLSSLPAMASEFHSGAAEVQLTLTACVVGLGIGQLVAGPLSDTYGRRRPLLVGLALYAGFSVACAVAPSIPALIGFRVVQALGGAAGLVIARAIARDLYSGRALARFFSLLMLVNGVAPVVAPVFGSQLTRITSWRGVFVVLAVIGVALLLSCARWLGETLPPLERNPGSIRITLRTYRKLLTDRVLIGNVLAAGLGFGALFAYISGSSFVLQDIFGLSPQEFSLIFAANSIGIVATGQLNGRLVRRLQPRRLLAIGLSVTVLGGLCLLAAVLLELGLPAIMPALLVLASSIGMVMPNATALALSDHPAVAGSASALLGAGQFALGGLAAPLVGLGGTATALPMAMVIAAAAVSALLAFATLTRRARPTRPT